jgi:hypothetical protein
MNRRRVVVTLVVVVGLLVSALPAAAQGMNEPLTWLINITVKPGKMMDLKSAAEKYDQPILDKLVLDGAISSWGLACQVVGPPQESCFYYATAANWAGLGRLQKAFMANRAAMKESEMKAMTESMLQNTDPSKETSSVARHVVFHVRPGGAPHFLLRHIYKFKPGKGEEAVKLYKEYIEPTYQKLLDSGVIAGFGLAVPEMRSGATWTHTSWIVFSDMTDLDAVDKAFEEAGKARGKALNSMLDSAFLKMSVPDAHVDSLAHLVLHGQASAK